MSHHHRQRYESTAPRPAEPVSKPLIPFFEKNDLAFLALIKPLLSSNAQKIVDLVLIFGGGSFQESPHDLTGLLSQLNISGETNPVRDLLFNLVNSMNNQETKTNPNLAMLTTLLNSLNQKNKPQESQDSKESTESQDFQQ
jgi:hypothetical protein